MIPEHQHCKYYLTRYVCEKCNKQFSDICGITGCKVIRTVEPFAREISSFQCMECSNAEATQLTLKIDAERLQKIISLFKESDAVSQEGSTSETTDNSSNPKLEPLQTLKGPVNS